MLHVQCAQHVHGLPTYAHRRDIWTIGGTRVVGGRVNDCKEVARVWAWEGTGSSSPPRSHQVPLVSHRSPGLPPGVEFLGWVLLSSGPGGAPPTTRDQQSQAHPWGWITHSPVGCPWLLICLWGPCHPQAVVAPSCGRETVFPVNSWHDCPDWVGQDHDPKIPFRVQTGSRGWVTLLL